MYRHFSSTVYVLEKWNKAKTAFFALGVEKGHEWPFSTYC
jgi:hypothetical protein